MSGLDNIGVNALLAFQRALQTTSHNVANVGTDGYSRQRVDMQARPAQIAAGSWVGSGVQVAGVRRLGDDFLLREQLAGNAEHGRLDALADMAARVDELLSDPASGLSQPLARLFDALSGLQAEPASAAARQEVLGALEQLGDRFGMIDQRLEALVGETAQRTADAVQTVNRITTELARLNREIPAAQARAGGQPPNDLLDARDRLLRELSQIIGIQTQADASGAVNVYSVSGLALVVGATRMPVEAVPDPLDGTRLRLQVRGGGGPVPLDAAAVGGEIGGMADFLREVLDPARAQVGRVAAVLGERLNAIHAQGVDLLGRPGGELVVSSGPVVQAAADNGGSASLQAAWDDPSALDGLDLRLEYRSGTWRATTFAGTEVPVRGSGSAGDPLRVGGVALRLSGTPADGDRFLLRPAGNAAADFAPATLDPRRLAAADPVSVAAAVDNRGDGRIALSGIVDPAAPGYGATARIEFVDAGTLRIDGGAPQPYTSGQSLEVNGVAVRISGAPQAGDVFELVPSGPNSADGSNAARMAAMRDARLLDGGSSTLVAAHAEAVARIGDVAGASAMQRDAVATVREQVEARMQSVSGVNLDEEAANLLRFQQAYEAAAQILRVSDEMFDALLSAVRR